MAGEFAPARLEDTTLWRRLERPFRDESATRVAVKIAQELINLCKIARDRMKLMPVFHPEFTLHDEVHLLRVTELMARIIPEGVLNDVLNPVEIALLILAAHFHDLGMIPDAVEVERIRASEDFQLSRQNWLVDYAGYQDAIRILENKDGEGVDQERCKRVLAEFEQVVFGRFIRENHAKRSAEFIKGRLGSDERLRVGSGYLADSLALLCWSHNWLPEHINEGNGFYYDKAVGTFPANLAYLATILRLADILDFDRERTPDELYRSISFTSPISIEEWEKHRQVEGWKIDRDAVRFECACVRPEYERTIRYFLRSIDEELAAAHDIVRRFPKSVSQYAFDLPARTDTSRIRPKDDAYLYASDLEISLDRNAIVRLLMTEKLYGHPSLAIRELLQNAWDALRHRRSIMKRDDGVDWQDGHVEFEHGVDVHNREFVRCSDNGAGMDQQIVKQFLVRAGRSYYRSPEFERERLTFARAKADFDPCARFGIGFMSLFMLGDKINIMTRRYRGSSGGLGEPLLVEINGIGGLIVLRKGADNQPAGTTMEIIGRRKPERFATWRDRVHLVDTIYSYAMAGEFPVTARCTIPEIKDEVNIPAGIAEPWHPLVEFDVKNRVIFEQDFNEIDPRLRGKVMCALPLSEEGRLVVSNSAAGWRQEEGTLGPSFRVAGGDKFTIFSWEGRTCIDGILVAGPHGRSRRHAPLVGAQYRNPVHFGEDLFVLDVRGDLKPELSPDRAPPERRGMFDDGGPTWRKLKRLAARAHGRLWENVIESFCDETNAKALWQLMVLHGVRFESIRRGFMWSHLLVPSLREDGELFFRKFEDLNGISFGVDSARPFERENNGECIGADTEMLKWHSGNTPSESLLPRRLRSAVLSMATLALKNNVPTLQFLPPQDPEELGFTSIVFDRFEQSFSTVPFGENLDGVLAVRTSDRLINKRHAIAQYLLAHQEDVLDDPEFAFLHNLAGALTEDGALEALESKDFSNRRFNWHFSGLGYHFRNVDLKLLRPELRPPYTCWLPEKGLFQITEEALTELAKIQLIDWHRHTEPRHI